MKRALAVGLLVVTVSGCASMMPQPRQVTLSTTFDAGSVSWFDSAGTGSINGQAFFQTRGGQPRTCAGLEVGLFPKSSYGDERLTAIYGTTKSGYAPALATRVQFIPDDSTYTNTHKSSVCDAQGNFSFTGLPAGEYFIIANIVWTVPGGYMPEGGALMQSVSLSDGESERVILTP